MYDFDYDAFEPSFKDLHPGFKYPYQQDNESDEDYEDRCLLSEEEYLESLKGLCPRCLSGIGCNYCLML